MNSAYLAVSPSGLECGQKLVLTPDILAVRGEDDHNGFLGRWPLRAGREFRSTACGPGMSPFSGTYRRRGVSLEVSVRAAPRHDDHHRGPRSACNAILSPAPPASLPPSAGRT